MRTSIRDFQSNADVFGTVVDSVGVDTPADWAAPSPCEDWTAAAVVDHVVDTQRDFLERQGADLGPRPEGTAPEVWTAHRKAVDEVVGDDDFVSREYDGYFGRTSIEDTLANFYGFDMLIHRWDLATALGTSTGARWSDDELDRIEAALDGFGDNLYADGVCKPALDVPDDAPRQVRLLGRMGRRG
jgi:uncharacterized protein (TIGR03086 family)